MIEDIYYDDNYDIYQDQYVYLQEETETTFSEALQEMLFRSVIGYSVSTLLSYILFGRK